MCIIIPYGYEMNTAGDIYYIGPRFSELGSSDIWYKEKVEDEN